MQVLQVASYERTGNDLSEFVLIKIGAITYAENQEPGYP